ncbi:uncharacterized protein F5147DRAFT_659214 [Suillus discolor]|uniref:Uncharacterized protein n=1 Tax=Suillus discolor TaxID=1912936 RepID=A0A9P7EST9_9AGAM|nr:uncharacterized protein F5147DRAFT_659214 [Suillus discolor]KAG2086458.1 hypothetical protein F5147DRAFT_659214 [Suillus discolor]
MTSRSRSSSWSSEASVDATLWNGGAPQPANEHEKDKVDSMAKLKERLQLAEKINSRLEQLYQKYRLRWLEESYRARVLEEYAPEGVSTYPPHQISWNAPSPAQSKYCDNAEVQDQEGGTRKIGKAREHEFCIVTPKQNVEVSRMMRAPRWRLTCWSKINDPVQALALKYWMSFSPFQFPDHSQHPMSSRMLRTMQPESRSTDCWGRGGGDSGEQDEGKYKAKIIHEG